MALVHRRSVKEHLALGQPLPLGSTGTLHQRSQPRGEQIPALADVHNVHLTPAIWQRRAALAFSLHFVHSHSLLFIRKRSEFFIDSIPIPDPNSC